ncbi:MAG: phosphodiester glycosidase family protein [Candidatus Eremiobacteraeota bacterium]|nr:phosphodiester glycosidase family protein [Candidatus Eremiobacteraeota bacterium]
MSARVRRSIFAIIVACGVAAVAAFFLRGPLLRAVFVARAQSATELALDVDRVDEVDGSFRLTGLRAHTRGGSIVVEAPSARATERNGGLTLVLDRPRIVVALDRLRGDEFARVGAALAKRLGADPGGRLTLTHGTLTFVNGAVPVPVIACDDVNVSGRARSARVAYELTLNLRDGASGYPIESRTIARGDGSRIQSWSAAVLPAASLAALGSADTGVRAVAGRLLDARVDDDGVTLHASARLDDVDFALGAHRLAALHGELIVDGGGVGSKKIAGTLDGAVPFEASGEVHDLPGGLASLRDGSNELRALDRLLERIAAEPNLRSVRVEATAPGLAFAQYGMQTANGPLAVSVLSADPAEPTLRFDTAIAEDHIISGGERTSAMGVRTHAVAGVNGDYFDIGRTYQPQGMLVRSGSLVRGPTDRAAALVDKANHVRFAEFHFRGTVTTSRGIMPLTEFNDWPPGNVALITPAFGKALPASDSVTFVGLQPVDSAKKRFRVVSIAAPGTHPRAGFGIAIGRLVHVSLPRIGEVVKISYGFDPTLDGAVAVIGGGPILLRDGAWYEDPHAPAPEERLYRWPVLALARQADDRLLLVAVDGRHPERSVGATRPEFAALLQRLGAVDAMALDSGGSVTLVSRAPGDANASVRNVPSDNSAERWISDALFLYSSAPAPSIVPAAQAPTPAPEMRPAP